MIKNCMRDNLEVGKMYGNLKVLEYAGYELSTEKRTEDYRKGEEYSRRNHFWKVECSVCHNVKLMREKNIKNCPKSCGCDRFRGLRERSEGLANGSIAPTSGKNNGMYKHGESHSKLNHIWKHMRYKCEKESNNAYKYFGALGISVCDEWKDPINGYDKFSTWAKENGYSDDLNIKLERKDKSKGFSPDNCIFESAKKVANSKPTVNRKINWDGVEYTLSELCNRFGANKAKASNRIHEGKSLEEAVLAKDWIPGWDGKFERDAYIMEHGEYRQHPENVTAFVFTKYPTISTIDPELQYMSVEELAKKRNILPVQEETEEDYQKAREIAKQNLIKKLYGGND